MASEVAKECTLGVNGCEYVIKTSRSIGRSVDATVLKLHICVLFVGTNYSFSIFSVAYSVFNEMKPTTKNK